MQTSRGRITHFTSDGTPVIAVMPDAQCADDIPDNISARHFSWTADGLERLAYAWSCCDSVCPDDTTLDACYDGESCYVKSDCFPWGVGPGILRRITLHLFDVDTCASARNVKASLCYDDDPLSPDYQTWTGSVVLRGGTLNLKFECVDAILDPTDPGAFKLSWTGCTTAFGETDTGTLLAGASCVDPLVIDFGQTTLQHCCDCRIVQPPEPHPDQALTTVNAEINFFLATNCRKEVVARIVDFDLSTGNPVVAFATPCAWNQIAPTGCAMKCPLVATITAVDPECAGMNGTFRLSYAVIGDEWHSDDLIGCGAGFIAVHCTDNGNGTVTLDVDVQAGATNSGQGSATITYEELEDLDVTVPISMDDPEVCECVGFCTWTYNEMAATWSLTGDTCACGSEPGTDPRPNDCDECPEGPASPPGSPTDGQVHSEPCTGEVLAPCCIGDITVRLVRQ